MVKELNNISRRDAGIAEKDTLLFWPFVSEGGGVGEQSVGQNIGNSGRGGSHGLRVEGRVDGWPHTGGNATRISA